MVWYKKVLIKYRKETVRSAITAIIFSITLLLWHSVMGKHFVWENIEPISAPSIFDRYVYSALTFISLGAFLYWIKFYKYLYRFIYGFTKDWELYKDIKRFIWGGLILIMYLWVVPKIVDILNTVISFFYNILGIIIYALPPLGFSLAISIPTVIFINQKKIIK